MNIENDVFKKSIVDYKLLINYGFVKDNNNYIYTKNILNNRFKIIINIINDLVNGKIIDNNINEEYINYRIEDYNGEFVSSIRDEYIKLLNDIKKNCFITKNFIYEQSERINKYIESTLGDKIEYLWKKYPGYGIYRNKNNNKWYAIIMNINKNKISSENKEVEIINLKVDNVSVLLKKCGYYPAYHMNKKYWITIILDDTIPDEEVIKLINKSKELVK